MPEITETEMRAFLQYQNLGSPREIEKKIGDLESDNKKYRDRIRDMSDKLPADGTVAIPKEDADVLAKFKELGTVEDVVNRLAEGDSVRARLVEVETRGAAERFVKAAGLAEETVDTLIAIPTLKDAKFEVRKKKIKDDKGQEVEVEVGYLQLSGEEKAMSFNDAQDKIPALKGLRVAETPKQKDGVNYLKQSTQEGGQGLPFYERIRLEAKQKQEAAKKAGTGKSLEERLGMVRTQ